jgi:hypothetical protein
LATCSVIARLVATHAVMLQLLAAAAKSLLQPVVVKLLVIHVLILAASPSEWGYSHD